MVRHWFLFQILLLVCLGEVTLAETLVVRSGEHTGFTRLVTRLPEPRTWHVEQNGETVLLSVSGGEVIFDVSTVFDRIPRSRVRDLKQTGNGQPLEVSLNCECDIRSFEEAGGYVVIDVSDPSEAPDDMQADEPTNKVDSPRGIVLPLGNLGTALAVQARQPEGSPDTERSNVARQYLGLTMNIPSDRTKSRSAAPQIEIDATDLSRNKEEQASSALSYAERQLQKQISRAISQGLVEPQRGEKPKTLTRLFSEGEPVAPPVSINLRALTSVDRDLGQVSGLKAANGGDVQCLNPNWIDIRSWGDDRSFGQQIGAYRMRLAGEFDDLSLSDIRALARTYLFFGFGAEAKVLLDSFPQPSVDLAALQSIALLLDDMDLLKPHPFAGQSHCDSSVALWAVLADPIETDDGVHSDAVLRAFMVLPAHLRKHLGPLLARRFTDFGDAQSADLVLRAIDRAQPPGDPEVSLARADLARISGETDLADALVEKVAFGGSDYSAEAMVSLVDGHFNKRQPLSNDDLSLLASHSFEARNSALGSKLKRAHALALALSGEFDEAFDVVASLDEPSEIEASAHILTLVAENADDVTFLELALGADSQRLDVMTEDQLEHTARRMLDLGFPDFVMELTESESLDSERFAVLRAAAALELGLPRRALLELAQEASREANQIRANALRQIGSYSQAVGLFAANEEFENAARSLWLSNSSTIDVVPAGTEYDGKIAAQSRLTAPALVDANATLAQARDLLKQASDTRRDISVLTGRN